MIHIGIAKLFVATLLLPHIAFAYVIPHPQEREGRRNPRIEIVRDLRGEPIRSARGTLLQRFLPEAPDDRYKKPSRRNIAQLRKARMGKLRMKQNKESIQKN